MEAYRARILVIDDEKGICEAIQKALEKSGYYVEIAHESLKAIEIFRQKTFHIAICDIKMPVIDGIKLLEMMKEEDPDISVIMITGYASIESAIESIKKGAQEYIRKPFRPDQIRLMVDKVLEQKKLVEKNTYLKGELKNIWGKDLIIGQSKVIRDVLNLAGKVAENNSPILITGESGTGKEVVARFIHYNSHRASMPFVTVNCAAIPEHLLESELFGHKKGAFTGAIYTKKGSFELAHEGTIFLDEVGEMRLDMQAKILRILENHEIKKVGAEETLHIDVRIIAATNKDLEKEMASGNFREDLYYRLHVIPIHIPPLRKYKEDIPLLARYFLNLLKAETKKNIIGFSEDALSYLISYDWPGNIRELKNAIERAVILAENNSMIRRKHFLEKNGGAFCRNSLPDLEALPTLKEYETEYIQRVLRKCQGNKAKAARILGINSVTLWRKTEKD